MRENDFDLIKSAFPAVEWRKLTSDEVAAADCLYVRQIGTNDWQASFLDNVVRRPSLDACLADIRTLMTTERNAIDAILGAQVPLVGERT